MSKLKIKVWVDLEIGIGLSDRWSDETSCKQIYKQSADQALLKIRELLGDKAVVTGNPKTKIIIEELTSDNE